MLLMSNHPIGRPYSPTNLSHPLIAFLGHRVATVNGAHNGTLADVHTDGTATITDDADIVVAVVPVATVIRVRP